MQLQTSVTIAIPAAACGLIIGKGGERINLLREQTQTKIMLQSKEKAVPGLNERTVTITGNLINAQMVFQMLSNSESKELNFFDIRLWRKLF